MIAESVITLDEHLVEFFQVYGDWAYLFIFLIILIETGVVILPFLPGDSLLFAAGTLAGVGLIHPVLTFLVISVAAIGGDSINYAIGYYIGPRVFREKNVRFLNREYLLRAEDFYEKHGGKAIFLARFVPIIRSFAPFVAGIGRMDYGRFLYYNIIGGFVWTALFVFGGYFFGQLPFVRENFFLIVAGIVILSAIPLVIEFTRHHKVWNQYESLNRRLKKESQKIRRRLLLKKSKADNKR